MINGMNKGVIVGFVTLAASAIAMTAAAQIAPMGTSTPSEEPASTTEEVTSISTTTGSVLGASTTVATPSADQEPVLEQSSDPRADRVQENAREGIGEGDPQVIPLAGAVSTSSTTESNLTAPAVTVAVTAADVTALEDGYYKKNGRYLQILPGNRLPDYEEGTVAEKLGAGIPTGMRVDVYESPKGFGYQIIYEDSGTLYTVGFGPEAEDRTYAYSLPVPSATSTSPVTE